MARIKLVIPMETFQSVVTQVENENKPSTQGELWKLVCETDWAKNLEPRALTAQVAMQRAKEMGVVITTQRGKKGGDGTFGGKRGQRGKAKGMSEESIQAYLNTVPDRALNDKIYNLLERAKDGKIKAMQKLNCLSCSNFQPSEIKNCTVKSCATYDIRPYQG